MEKRSAWRRMARFSVAGILVLALSAWAFLEFEPFRHRALTYETPPACPGGAPYRPGTYSTTWEGATLLIRAAEYPNCAEAIKRVSAHVIDDLVFLRIRYYSPSGETFACDCEKVTLVRLAGLAKRDYRIMRIWPP